MNTHIVHTRTLRRSPIRTQWAVAEFNNNRIRHLCHLHTPPFIITAIILLCRGVRARTRVCYPVSLALQWWHTKSSSSLSFSYPSFGRRLTTSIHIKFLWKTVKYVCSCAGIFDSVRMVGVGWRRHGSSSNSLSQRIYLFPFFSFKEHLLLFRVTHLVRTEFCCWMCYVSHNYDIMITILSAFSITIVLIVVVSHHLTDWGQNTHISQIAHKYPIHWRQQKQQPNRGNQRMLKRMPKNEATKKEQNKRIAFHCRNFFPQRNFHFHFFFHFLPSMSAKSTSSALQRQRYEPTNIVVVVRWKSINICTKTHRIHHNPQNRRASKREREKCNSFLLWSLIVVRIWAAGVMVRYT